MADETRTIRIVIDSSKAVDGSAAATRAYERMEKAQNETTASLDRMEGMMNRVGGLLAGKFGAQALMQAVDAFTQFSNALKVAGVEGSTAAAVQERLFAAANRNGVEILTLSQVYSRASIAAGELGASQEQLLKFVDGTTAALRIQGGSSEAAKGALLQLSQALSSGTVRAEEFNSILEGAFPIAQAAARGMDGMGGSVAKLRTAVLAGTVSSQEFFQALLKGFGETEKTAQSATLTIAQSLTGNQNAWTRLIGTIDQATGISATFAEHIAASTRHLDEMAKGVQAGAGELQPFIQFIETTKREIALLGEGFDKLEKFAKSAAQTMGEWFRQYGAFVDGLAVEGARGSAMFIEAFRALPELLGKLFVDGMNKAIEAVETGLNKITGTLASSWLGQYLGIGGAVSLGRLSGGGFGDGSYGAGIQGAGDAAAAEMRARQQAVLAERERQALIDRQAGMWGDEARARIGGMLMSGGGGGAAAAAAKGGGGKAAIDEVAKLIEKIEKDAQRAREAFEQGTDALEAQNEVLALELKLTGEVPEVRARELAILKATNDAKKAGIDLNSQEFKDRLAAVDTGEKLKIQQQELQRSQELWTEPLKQALRDTQSIGADAFDKLLESGKFSFEELQQTFMRIIRRMAAEFLALATIRPVMSVLVNAVSPAFAQSMGLGSTGLGGIGGTGGGSLGLGGIGGGGFLSSIGGWLNSPISGNLPSGMYGPPAPGQGFSSGFLGDITWLQGAGALAGAGMGVYQLLSGGGSTSSTIGGISSILGAGVSLIPGIGQIAGPAIALLGNLLPGLLGMNKPPTITNQEYGDLTYGSNGFFTSGGAWGPNANATNAQGALGGMGTTMQGIFNALGGVKDPSKVWGVALQNFSQQYGDKSSFSNQTSFLAGPNGERIQWGQGSTTADVGLEAAGLAAALKSILGGAVGEISKNLEKGLGTLNLDGKGTLAQLAAVVAEIKTFDDAIAGLNKTVTSAEQAVLAIDQSFAAMYATAEKYGLDVGAVDSAKAAARLGVATDFAKGIRRDILAMTDPGAAALEDLDSWKSTMVENNKWLLDNVAGTLDQINEIERLYGLKRAAIVEQSTSNALGSLKNTLDRLLYGDLSGASPGDALAGAYGNYQADLAKANLGDAAAATRLNSSSADYMQAAAGYYGTASAAYQGLRKQTIIDVASAYRYNGGQFADIPGAYDVIMGGGGFTGLPGMGAGSLNIGLGTVSTQLGELVATLQSSDASDEELKQLMKDLLDKMTRLVMGNAG